MESILTNPSLPHDEKIKLALQYRKEEQKREDILHQRSVELTKLQNPFSYPLHDQIPAKKKEKGGFPPCSRWFWRCCFCSLIVIVLLVVLVAITLVTWRR